MKARAPDGPWRDRGAALLIVMVAAAFVAALALATVVVVETERRIEGTFEWSMQARESAAAGADRVVSELSVVPDWSAALSGALTGIQDAGPWVVTAGGAVDLDAVGATLQAESDVRFPGALNRAVWRLFESGRVTTLTGAGPPSMGDYVAVWIADDPWESDNDPTLDGNGVIGLHAEAWGAAGARATVDATIAHGPPEAGCVMTAGWNYDSGRSRLSVLASLTAHEGAGTRPGDPGIVLAAWQGSGVDDPCHARGPGVMIVTWREVG